MLSDTSPSQQENTAWSHFAEVSKIVRLTEAGSRTVVIRSWGQGKMELWFSWYKVSVMQDELVLEVCCTAQGLVSTGCIVHLKIC